MRSLSFLLLATSLTVACGDESKSDDSGPDAFGGESAGDTTGGSETGGTETGGSETGASPDDRNRTRHRHRLSSNATVFRRCPRRPSCGDAGARDAHVRPEAVATTGQALRSRGCHQA